MRRPNQRGRRPTDRPGYRNSTKRGRVRPRPWPRRAGSRDGELIAAGVALVTSAGIVGSSSISESPIDTEGSAIAGAWAGTGETCECSRSAQPADVVGGGRPGTRAGQPKFLGFAPGDLMIHSIVGDSPDVPEGAGTRSVGIKKKERPRLSGRDFKIESVDVSAIDRFETDRQGDIAKTQPGDFGDEGRRDLRRFAQVEHGAIAFFDQPFQALGRGRAAAGQLEVDGNEPLDSRPDAGRRADAGPRDWTRGQVEFIRRRRRAFALVGGRFAGVCEPALSLRSAAGGTGGVAADFVTSPGKSSGGR